jgi:hypothetical protein
MKEPDSLFEARPNGGGAAGADHVVVDIENLDDRAGCKLITARAEFQCGSDYGQVSSRESRYDGRSGGGAGDSELGFRSQPELKAALITISGS